MPGPPAGELVLVIGNLTIDDVVLPDGTTRMARLGGNSVHAATAAVTGGASAALAARRGEDFPPGALAALPQHSQDVITGKEFFPQLMSGPFHDGLVVVFSAAALMTIVGAIACLTWRHAPALIRSSPRDAAPAGQSPSASTCRRRPMPQPDEVSACHFPGQPAAPVSGRK